MVNELGRIWKKVVVSSSEVLSRNFSERTEENRENFQSEYSPPALSFQTGTFQKLSKALECVTFSSLTSLFHQDS
jgi:hypothetical protein